MLPSLLIIFFFKLNWYTLYIDSYLWLLSYRISKWGWLHFVRTQCVSQKCCKKKKSTVTSFACFFFKMEGIYSSFFAFDMLKRIRTIGSYDEVAHAHSWEVGYSQHLEHKEALLVPFLGSKPISVGLIGWTNRLRHTKVPNVLKMTCILFYDCFFFSTASRKC